MFGHDLVDLGSEGDSDSHTAEVVTQKAARTAEVCTLSSRGEPGPMERLDKLYPAASALVSLRW